MVTLMLKALLDGRFVGDCIKTHCGGITMRITLQDRSNRLYYTGQNSPLGELDRAINFATVGAAAQLALAQRLPQMQIVVRYDVAAAEVSLPVLAEWPGAAKPL